MHVMQDRRRLLAMLSSATAAGLLGSPNSFAQEPALETTSLRLSKIPGVCVAPQYVAEELLKAEGFTNVQYFEPVRIVDTRLARGPALKNLSRPKVEWGLICSPAHDARKFVRMGRL
jgi:hypothetical protein